MKKTHTFPAEPFISKLPKKDLFEILDDFREFEEKGSIGDSKLRKHAERYSSHFKISPNFISITMASLAHDIYRYLYIHKIYKED